MTSSSRMFILALLGSALVLPSTFSADSGSQQSTLSLPLGCWKITANGNLGTLCIPALNADNTFKGTMTINGEAPNPIAGLWSSSPQQVTFLRLPPAESLHVSVVCRYPVSGGRCESDRTTSVGRHI